MQKLFSSEVFFGVGAVMALFAFMFLGALNGGVVNNAFAQVSTTTQATINVTVNQTITLSLSGSPMNLSNLTPGTPVTATSSATVVTNSVNGWNLQVKRDSSTSTLASSTIAFPDATAWNGSNSATTDTIGANFHFKVANTGTDAGLYSSAFWGPNDTDGASNAKYAGFPTTNQTVVTTSTYSSASQVAVLRIRANASASQRATNYTGTITVTAITNP